MDKLDEFMVWTKARFEQLQDQVDAQQMIIGWLLSQLEETEYFDPDLVRGFLYHQADELADSPKFREYVAVIDSLFEDVVRLSSRRHRRDQT